MNAFGPPHARVFKEMIIVSDPAKPLEFTPKGTPRRHASLVLYASDIEALYTLVAQSAHNISGLHRNSRRSYSTRLSSRPSTPAVDAAFGGSRDSRIAATRAISLYKAGTSYNMKM